jgi:hypothetical protein
MIRLFRRRRGLFAAPHRFWPHGREWLHVAGGALIIFAPAWIFGFAAWLLR